MEIADRQRTLDGYPPVASGTAVAASESLPRAHTQDLSGLEQQLRQINTRIETLTTVGDLEALVRERRR